MENADDSADDYIDDYDDGSFDDGVYDSAEDYADDYADDNTNYNANDTVPKYISITKIKYTGKKQTGDNVKELVKTFLDDNLKIRGTLESETEIDRNGRKIFTITRNIKKESKQAGEKDKNHGQLCFVYWESDASVDIYCLADTGRSGAWTSLCPIRDFSFPRKFAKTFLNSRNIRTVEVNYLANTSDSSTVSLSFEKGKFQSYDIMDQYGIVKSFSASIDQRTPHGSNLFNTLLMASPLGDNPIKVQKGQIRLPLFVTKKKRKISTELHINMLLMIDENITCQTKSFFTDQDWNFYDYIQPIFDKNKIEKLKNKLIERVFDYLCNKENNQELPVNSKLTYVHQDCFDASRVNLLFNRKIIAYFPRGEYVTLKEVIDHIDGIKQSITKPTNLNQIKLQFYDWVEQRKISKPFLEMVQCHLIVQFGDEMVPAFKFNGNWYLVKLDSCFDITINFVDVVKKCLTNVNSDNEFPEVLPWSHKTEAKNKTSKTGSVFSMDVLYDFCYEFTMKPEERKEEIAKLKDILTKTTHLLIDQNNGVMRPTELDGKKVLTYKNNFLRGVDLEDPLSQSNQHSLELLSLNTCMFKKRKDPFPKDLQESVINEDVFEIEETSDGKKSLEFCQQFKKGLQTLGKFKETFRVSTPYLSIDIWKEIEEAGINICPVRLVQFLRMWWTHLDEGDYNELYHLSNCKCRRHNHDFIYVVGDRILDNENHLIELFDVMAVNLKAKTFYLLHVKSGFCGESARDMCSQVRVCGQLLWQSLSIPTSDNRNMLQKFYAVATKSSQSIHNKLTKNEVKMIGESEEEFLEVMMCGAVKYHVCAAPGLPKKSFSSVLNTNLNHEFKKGDFENNRVFFTLKETGVIDRIKKTINPIIFDKSKFLQTIAEKIPKAEQVYKEIFKIIAGGESDSLIKPRRSLIAKIMLIDLYKKFNNFGSSVQLGIIVVPTLNSKVPAATEHNDPNQSNMTQTKLSAHYPPQTAACATQNTEQEQVVAKPEIPKIQPKLSKWFQPLANLKRQNNDNKRTESKVSKKHKEQ